LGVRTILREPPPGSLGVDVVLTPSLVPVMWWPERPTRKHQEIRITA
jgi:hypothetical protein